jgi:hypothetical protein
MTIGSREGPPGFKSCGDVLATMTADPADAPWLRIPKRVPASERTEKTVIRQTNNKIRRSSWRDEILELGDSQVMANSVREASSSLRIKNWQSISDLTSDP